MILTLNSWMQSQKYADIPNVCSLDKNFDDYLYSDDIMIKDLLNMFNCAHTDVHWSDFAMVMT